MAKLKFIDIINTHKNKTGVAVATGSCLKPHLNKIIHLSNNNEDSYTIVSVNEHDTMFPNLRVDYRVVANSFLTILNQHHRFNNTPNTPLIYADTVDLTDKKLVDSLLNIDYLPYDQRHFNENHCTWGDGKDGRSNCCNQIELGRLTIQEELQKYCGYDKHYGSGDTVALHMLTTLILLGCNPIYVVGTDLNYTKGYADGVTRNYDSFNPYLDRILNDFKIINDSAIKIGVKIYSICQDSPINTVFEYKSDI